MAELAGNHNQSYDRAASKASRAMRRTDVVAYLARRSGLACLEAMAGSEFQPGLLFTHRYERGTKQVRPELGAFKDRAARFGIPLSTPTKASLLSRLSTVDYDFFVSVNASCIFPSEIFLKARFAALNMHPSPVVDGRMLFPGGDTRSCLEQSRRRGIAGVTLHHMTSELDQGPIVVSQNVSVAESDTIDSLYDRLLPTYPHLLLTALRSLAHRA